MREHLSGFEKKEAAKKRRAAARKRKATEKKARALEFIESVIATMNSSSDILSVSETVRKSTIDLLVKVLEETGIFHEELSKLQKLTDKMSSHLDRNHILEAQKNGVKIRLYEQLLKSMGRFQDVFHEFIIDMASNALVMQSVVSQLRKIGDEIGEKGKSGSTRHEGSLS